jgi:adenylate cyclase
MESGLQDRGILEVKCVLGEGMARVAATVSSVFLEDYLRRGDSERDVALRFAAMAEQLSPAVAPVLVAAQNAHLREIARGAMIRREQLQSGQLAGAQEMVIRLADLVGFTALDGQIAPEELGGVAGQLAELAAEVAVAPVRLVKTIGDAAREELGWSFAGRHRLQGVPEPEPPSRRSSRPQADRQRRRASRSAE